MLSSKPYLLRALYDWIVDSGCTPHLVANAEIHGVVVPADYVTDGQIVLNIAPSAISDLNLGAQDIEFSARFGGKRFAISLPIVAVLGIYARENGLGMEFDPEQADSEPPEPSDPVTARPALKLVK